MRLEATPEPGSVLGHKKAGEVLKILADSAVFFISQRLEHGRFVVRRQRVAGKVDDQESQVIDLGNVLGDLTHFHDEFVVVCRLGPLVEARDNLLFQVDDVQLCVLFEVFAYLGRQIHMYLVILHQLLNFRHFLDQLSHLCEVHFVRVGAAAFSGVRYNFLELCVDVLADLCQVLVAESNPQIVLLVQVHCPIIGAYFTILRDIFEVVNKVLVRVIVYHGRDDVKAAVDDEQIAARLSWPDLLRPFVKLLQARVYFVGESFAEV